MELEKKVDLLLKKMEIIEKGLLISLNRANKWSYPTLEKIVSRNDEYLKSLVYKHESHSAEEAHNEQMNALAESR